MVTEKPIVKDKTVTILGTGSTRVQCPYDETCGEVWGVNGAYAEVEIRKNRGLKARLDKLFATDYLFSPQGHLHFDIDRVNRILKEYNCEFVSLHPLKLGKYKINTKSYPFKRIVKKFNTDFFSSTICYMMAYALDKGYTDFRLYGIDMQGQAGLTGGGEYAMQRPGVEYWIGRAMERGCKVYIAPGGTVMQLPHGLPYGFRPKVDFKMIDPNNLLKLPESMRK